MPDTAEYVCRHCKARTYATPHRAPYCPDTLAHGPMVRLVRRNVPSPSSVLPEDAGLGRLHDLMSERSAVEM